MLKWLLLSIPLLALGAYFAGHAVLGPQLAPGNVTSPTTTTPSPIATVTPDTSTTATPTVVTLATGRWVTSSGCVPEPIRAMNVNRLSAPGDFYRHAHPEAHKRRWP